MRIFFVDYKLSVKSIKQNQNFKQQFLSSLNLCTGGKKSVIMSYEDIMGFSVQYYNIFSNQSIHQHIIYYIFFKRFNYNKHKMQNIVLYLYFVLGKQF